MKKLILLAAILATQSANAFDVYAFVPYGQELHNHGIKRVKIAYENRLFNEDEEPCAEKIKTLAQERNAFVSFDYEPDYGEIYNPGPVKETAKAILKYYRRHHSSGKRGLYAILPVNTYGVKGIPKAKALNKQYAELARHVNVFSPVLYNYDGDDYYKWLDAAKFSIEEAKKYRTNNQPIIAYISPVYWLNQSGTQVANITYKDMQRRLNALKRLGAQGAIIWASSQTNIQAVDVNGGWELAAIEAANQP